MKILINTPPTTYIGGVANHYKGLKRYWCEDVYYNYIGGRYGIPGPIIIFFDVLKFIYKLIFINPDVVLLNPSLGRNALLRDSLYLYISKLFGNKTILLFQGWDIELEKDISQNPDRFVYMFNRADYFLVQGNAFRDKLKTWGITKPIQWTTTKVDDALIESFSIGAKEYNKTILFLARVEVDKGIFTALKAFDEIKSELPSCRLIVAGTGGALNDAKNFVKKHQIPDVEFKGYITGKELRKTFRQADIYLFPTDHGEGIPTSILEAMAFGLPVIARPVGGIGDFFENDEMGYLIESQESEDFAKKCRKLLSDTDLMKKIGLYNQRYAKEHFMASKVAVSLEEVFKKVKAYE